MRSPAIVQEKYFITPSVRDSCITFQCVSMSIELRYLNYLFSQIRLSQFVFYAVIFFEKTMEI
jgi:hypothetical protein